MKKLLIFSVIISFLFLTGMGKDKRKWRTLIFNKVKKVEVKEPVNLKIDNISPVFDVEIKPSNSQSEIAVSLKGKIKCLCNVSDFIPILEKKGDVVKVSLKEVYLKGKSKNKDFSVETDAHFFISIPQNMVKSISFNSDSSDLSFSGISGLNLESFSFITSSGDLTFKKDCGKNTIKSGNIKSDSGDIELFSLNGDNFVIKSSSGDVELEDSNFKVLEVETKSGNIRLSSLKGDNLKLKSSSGDMDLEGLNTGVISASTNYGNVWGEDINSDDVNFSSSSGDMSLKGLNSKSVSVSTNSGNIQGDKINSDDMNFSSSSGDVELKVVSEFNRLKVTSSSGDVGVKVIEGDYHLNMGTDYGDLHLKGIREALIEEKHVEAGKVGEPEIYLHTKSGDVTLKWVK